MRALKGFVVVRPKDVAYHSPGGLIVNVQASVKKGIVISSGIEEIKVGDTVLYTSAVNVQDGVDVVPQSQLLAVEE